MYIFEASYTNLDTMETRVQIIEFLECSFSCEKECYSYAMKIAYEEKTENECLDCVTFIAG